MSSPHESLLQGDNPARLYEVERGVHTDSYIAAVSNNPIPPYGPGAPYAKKSSPEIAYIAPQGEPTVPLSRPASRTVDRPSDQIGLTERELRPYRDDPFWKRLRCVLFWLFWIIWILLFLLVLLIVIFSPKCTARLTPNWWQSSIAYSVWVPSYSDSDGDGMGDVNGLIEKLEVLRKTGVQSVWPRPFLLSDEFTDAIRDHNALDSKLGVNTDADKLIEAVHDMDMRIIVDLPVATTSLEHDWFLRSQAASLPENKDYAEFYTWSEKSGLDKTFFTPHKNTQYFHKENEPSAAVLNWADARVKMAIFEVISSWITRGIDGFHLVGIEYLARSPNFTQPDWKVIREFVADIRTHVETFCNESAHEGEEPKKIIVFASLEDVKEADKRALVSELHLHSLVNYELTRVEKNTKICHKNEGNVGICTYEILADVLLFHSLHDDIIPAWEFGNPSVARLASRTGSRRHAELLLMLQLLLPGSNSFYYGDELGMRNLPNDSVVAPQRGAMQWDASQGGGFTTNLGRVPISSDYRQYEESQSPLKTFIKLSKLRKHDETMIKGKALMGPLVDHSAFTLARFLQKGTNETQGSVYVIGVNFAPSPVSLPLDGLPSQINLDRATVVAVSSYVTKHYPRQSLDLSEKALQLGPDEGIVFKYPSSS